MHLIATLIKWLKLFGADTRRAIVGYIVVGLILAGGGVVILTNTAITWVFQIANISTPLWATILLILPYDLYIYLIVRQLQNSQQPPNLSEELHRKSIKNGLKLHFGIYWDKEKNPYCPACKTPLNYFHDNEHNKYHTFECIKCNKEMSAKDINGNYLSLKHARELL